MNFEIVKCSNEEYHKDRTAISSSGIKKLRQSPAHFYSAYLDPDSEKKKPTPAMEFGTLVHALVLEPETVKDVCAELSSTTVKKFSEAEKNAQSILEHPAASVIKRRIGEPEFTIFWNEDVENDDGELSTVRCKVRFDWFVRPCKALPNGLALDVKTTTDASPKEFSRISYNLGYHIQAALYVRAAEVAFNVNETPFIFLAAEKEAPFGVVSYQASRAMLDAGKCEYKRLLKLYLKCLTSGVWPCYDQSIQQLDLPRWAKENYDD